MDGEEETGVRSGRECYLGWAWSRGRGRGLRLWVNPRVLLLTGGCGICWGRTHRRRRKGNYVGRKA